MPKITTFIEFTTSTMQFNNETQQYDLCLDGHCITVNLEAPEMGKIGNNDYRVLRITHKDYGTFMTVAEYQNTPSDKESVQDLIDTIPTKEEVEKTIIQQGMSQDTGKQLLGLRKVTVGALLYIKANLDTVDVHALRKYVHLCSYLAVSDDAFMDLISRLEHVVRTFGTCSEKAKDLIIPADSRYNMNKLHRLGIQD